MKTPFFTGKGDKGESHYGKVTLNKSSARAELLGTLDELDAWLGYCRVEAEKEETDRAEEYEIRMSEILKKLQNNAFVMQAEIAALVFNLNNDKKLGEDKTTEIEKDIERVDELVPQIKTFIIPGGSELSARLDLARTVARRAERQAKRLSEEMNLSEELLKYLNRLSSILFALARYANHARGISEEHPTY